MMRGIFSWAKAERQTDRYGMFYLDRQSFSGEVGRYDGSGFEQIKDLVGKKVKITAQVIESRKSGHIGDVFLGIFPTQPVVGEKIVLGVGELIIKACDYSPSGIELGIEPADGRRTFWCDPRKWYRLHDQTVDLTIEETDEEPEAPFKVGQ